VWFPWFSRPVGRETGVSKLSVPVHEVSGPLKAAAVYANSCNGLNSSIRSTGFRTYARRYESITNLVDDPGIASAFLVNTRLRRGDREGEQSIYTYFEDVSATMLALSGKREHATTPSVALPPPIRMPLALSEVVERRRSIRSYTGDGANLSELSTILTAAAGVTTQESVELQGSGPVTLRFRSVASAGGLYPIDVVFASINIVGLPGGIYRYDPIEHRLLPMFAVERVEALLGCFSVPEDAISIRRSFGVILLVGQPWRTMRKYGGRGMRFVFMEAGAIAHSVSLAATALGNGSVECASVYDDEVHEVLCLDGTETTLLHVIIIGCPA
jgi:SagB-type dehydrogenase family enzyme